MARKQARVIKSKKVETKVLRVRSNAKPHPLVIPQNLRRFAASGLVSATGTMFLKPKQVIKIQAPLEGWLRKTVGAWFI